VIDALDTIIAKTLVAAIPTLANRIGFQPPDRTWRDQVSAQPGAWLNCALVDLREDRARRSTGVRVERDPSQRVLPPFLLRCHYLISAWNSANENPPAVSATRAEHSLLGKVVAALAEHTPLRAAAVLLPAELATIPSAWRETTLDTELLPPDGFGKLAEFWQTMGTGSPWRPVVWLAVTVPVSPEPIVSDGVVTTILTSLGTGPAAENPETLLAVGGQVSDQAGLPVADALVLVTDAAGHLAARASTGADGRFVADGLAAGTYTLTARAAGQPAFAPLVVSVPTAAAGPLQLQPV
jgi:hypothetical protein